MGNSISSMHNVAGDISEKLDDLRSKALKNLHDMLSIYEKPIPTVRDDELDAFKLQVENRMLLVAFVGEGSSGKSTLINAILRDEFLPYGCERTTNLRIYIKHNPSIHIGRCQEGSPCERCPKLCENLGGKSGKQKKICTGVNDISKQISSRNKEAENSKVTVVLVIEANVEMFEGLTLLPNAQSHTVYIVDCPGMECLREDTMEFFSITSQMIYILNYSRFLQDREKVVNELREKPSSAQLLFAVTYFDVYYTPGTGKENPDENKVKQLVSKAFNDVQENDVFPLCGKWVLNAYLLKKRPYDSDSQLVVRKAYEEYMRRQTESSSSVSEQNHMIDTILEIGGVQALEDRIRRLVGDTDLNRWNRVICNQAEILLQKPIKAAKDLQEEIESDFKALKKLVDAHQIKDRKIDQALDHINNSRDEGFVTRETKEKFNIEDFLSKAETELVSTLNIFKDQCYRDVRDSVYTIESFENEFETFKEETIPYKIKEVYQNQFMAFFYSWTEVLRAELKDVVSLLKEDIFITDYPNAELIYPVNTRLRFFDPLKTKRESIRSQRFYHWVLSGVGAGGAGITGSVGALKLAPIVGALLPTIVAAPVAIVGIPLSLGVCIYQGYRAWNTDEKKVPLSQADLEEIHEQTMKDIKSAHNIDLIRKYLESGKALFCQKTCKDIVEEAQKLWDKYEENWKEHREEFTRKLTENIDKLQRITAEKSKLEAALDELEKGDAFLQDVKKIVPIIIEESD